MILQPEAYTNQTPSRQKNVEQSKTFSSDEDIEIAVNIPDTPKKSLLVNGTPTKTNPFPRLAVPRSAKELLQKILSQKKLIDYIKDKLERM